MRALTSGLRWKLRNGANMGKRHVFALDSQVVIGVAVKGRKSSQQLRNALLQFNLLILSTSCYSYFCYIQSSWNPADRPLDGGTESQNFESCQAC
eukprot:7771620-Karenia_brevis.AAC.1